MCVQARLALYNSRPGWVARQFMLEYAALFDALLPALERLGVPIPLGGTSNHFPRSVLEELGGWDAYNVTEDADLGMRIARVGGRVGVLDSTTYEEAPDQFSIWLPQRTRWMKGFMQTWLVHMRRPGRSMKELGLKGFFAFNALLGGIVLSALVHPIFLAVLLWELAAGRALVPPETALGGAMFALALFNLLAGYGTAILLAALAAWRRGLGWLMPHLLFMPLYWLMISLAAYRAALQLVTKPYYWEKTPHRARHSVDGRSRARAS
jgi:cellulose synthase/poly-beta-1,6-N-acetylglucosamine synthase-like glycosyltransferase